MNYTGTFSADGFMFAGDGTTYRGMTPAAMLTSGSSTTSRYRTYITSSTGTAVYANTTSPPVANQWQYVTGRADAGLLLLTVSLNGQNQGTKTYTTMKPAISGLNIAMSGTDNYFFKGRLDELRISNVVRTDGWIQTEYNTMANANLFVKYGPEIRIDGGSKYGSPLTLVNNNLWQWSNFTWMNATYPVGRVIGWKITYVDTWRNKVTTPVMSFTVGSGSSPFIVQGNCFYDNAKTQPVNTVKVTIRNLNTGQQWPASTTNNHYSLSLTPGSDVQAGHILRYTAKDTGHWVNITTHTVTSTDMSNNGITKDLILKEYYTDLTDFPYYPTDGTGGYSSQRFTAPAVLQMALDYMRWNTTSNPTCPTWTLTNLGNQAAIYNQIPSSQKTSTGYINARGVQQFLQAKKPLPYNLYGYDFNIKFTNCPWNPAFNTQDDIIGAICIWTDYSTSYADGSGTDDVALKAGYKPHVPALIPTLTGDYDRWMAVRGIHTQQEPWKFANTDTAARDETNTSSWAETIKVYGFWLNDPFTSGIGQNTYVTAQDFKNTYFKTITTPGDPYQGDYVTVVEPFQREKIPSIPAEPILWPEKEKKKKHFYPG